MENKKKERINVKDPGHHTICLHLFLSLGTQKGLESPFRKSQSGSLRYDRRFKTFIRNSQPSSSKDNEQFTTKKNAVLSPYFKIVYKKEKVSCTVTLKQEKRKIIIHST